MFAVIKTGGKQYRVAANDRLTVEKLAGSAGDMIEFAEVLMVGTGTDVAVGAPFALLPGAAVAAATGITCRGDVRVVAVVALIVPLLVPLPFLLLGTVVSIVQTLVFTLLSIIYIGLAIEHAEDH